MDRSIRIETVAMPTDPPSQAVIGVVVIGRNESARLEECLGSLTAYRGRVVYADSASADGSADLARDWGALVVDIDPATTLTPARGRNEGFIALLEHMPHCEFVQFVDGDSVVQADWIEAAASFLEAHKHVAAVCGHVTEEHPESSIYNWLCADEWKGTIGRIDACGGNAMFRVTAFREAGCFRGDLMAGEEAELMARLRALGWEIWRIDVPMVIHNADIHRFSDWWRRAKRGGYAYANVWSLTRNSAEPLYGAQLTSSLFWVLALPFAVAVLASLLRAPMMLFLVPTAWVMQIARISARGGLLKRRSWTYAAMIMLAKVPETLGVFGWASKRLARD